MYDLEFSEVDLELTELDGPLPVQKSVAKRPKVSKRNPKMSPIALDYDPFDEPFDVGDGYQRPPIKCWVDESIARPVSLADLSPLWREDITAMGTQDRRHRFLASIVAMVDGEFHVRRKHNGTWISKKRTAEVKNILWNEWGANETKLKIRKDTIERFFADASYVVLDQLAYIPGAGSFVQYKGKRCLNRYFEPPMAFPEDAILDENTNLLIELIVKNLLDHQGGELEDWLTAIDDDEPSAIKWLFHWLACLYQRQGRAHSSVLWFVGPAQGVGKGLFTSGLPLLLGSSNVKVASAEEFKGEWSDFLMNASLFVMDEVDFSSRKEANSKIKRLVSNNTVALRKRHSGEIEIPAVASYIFTTNNIQPLALDRGDRRNTFFHTSGSLQSKKRAENFYGLSTQDRQKAWEGFAELLAMIQIDEKLISKAFSTEVKQRMTESGTDPFDEWFQSDGTASIWPQGEFAPVAWIKSKYVDWAKNNAFHACATTTYCQKKLDEMVSEQFVSQKFRKVLNDGSKAHGYVRIDPECDEKITSAKDYDVIAPFRKSKRAADMKSKILKNRV